MNVLYRLLACFCALFSYLSRMSEVIIPTWNLEANMLLWACGFDSCWNPNYSSKLSSLSRFHGVSFMGDCWKLFVAYRSKKAVFGFFVEVWAVCETPAVSVAECCHKVAWFLWNLLFIYFHNICPRIQNIHRYFSK